MKIDIYFDTICPWCWVGKANLHKALEIAQLDDVEINYKTFFLYEGIPENGVPAKDHLKEKYNMTDAQEKEYLDRLVTLGKEVGVEFNLRAFDFIPNTLASHIMINQVPKERKTEIIEKIFFEVFNQGKNVGDRDYLREFMKKEELDIEKFDNALKDEAGKELVMREYYEGMAVGVKGVPFYVINDKYAVYGAQKPEMFVQVFNRVNNEASVTLL